MESACLLLFALIMNYFLTSGNPPVFLSITLKNIVRSCSHMPCSFGQVVCPELST